MRSESGTSNERVNFRIWFIIPSEIDSGIIWMRNETFSLFFTTSASLKKFEVANPPPIEKKTLCFYWRNQFDERCCCEMCQTLVFIPFATKKHSFIAVFSIITWTFYNVKKKVLRIFNVMALPKADYTNVPVVRFASVIWAQQRRTGMLRVRTRVHRINTS